MEAIISTLFNQAISTAPLLVLALILHLLLRKSSRRGMMLIWKLVFIRLFIFVLPHSPLSLLPRGELIGGSLADGSLSLESGIGGLDGAINSALKDSMEAGSSFLPVLFTVAGTVWALGAVAMLTYFLISNLLLARRLRFAVRHEGNVYISDGINAAFTFGVIRPRIYLPVGLTDSGREYIIAHERSHIKNGDNIFKALGFIALGIYWFDPLVWLAYISLSHDMEYYCDECVTRGKDGSYIKGYANVMLECTVPREYRYLLHSDFNGASIKSRIKNLNNTKKHAKLLFAIAIILAVLIVLFFFTRPPIDKLSEMNDAELLTFLEGAGLGHIDPEGADMVRAVIADLEGDINYTSPTPDYAPIADFYDELRPIVKDYYD